MYEPQYAEHESVPDSVHFGFLPIIQNSYAKTNVPVFLLTGQSNMSGYVSANDLTTDQKLPVENVNIYADMTWDGDAKVNRKITSVAW